MTDNLWQAVEVEYTTSTEPFLQDEDQIIKDPTKIVEHIQAQCSTTPAIAKQLKNARDAAKKVYKQALAGGEVKAPKDLIQFRRNICATCPFKNKKLVIERCSKCGCIITRKTALITESCPIGKW